ncbi:MAG: potassium-transporting ATPase subunit KdpC [Acidobacteriota bacterium]
MKSLSQSIRVLGLFTLLTGIVYPLLVTGFGRLLFPWRAGGSLILSGHHVIGSELIGQQFQSDRYFWGRPSASNYEAVPSSASNLGPTSVDLLKITNTRRRGLQGHAQADSSVPPELIFASGSGLDPHLGLEAVSFQIPRIARARGFGPVQVRQLQTLVLRSVEPRQWGMLGVSRINILRLNVALDQLLP